MARSTARSSLCASRSNLRSSADPVDWPPSSWPRPDSVKRRASRRRLLGSWVRSMSPARTRLSTERLTAGAPNRMVIFDSPPALAASPAAELAKHVGQAVLIARADHTGHAALDDAVQLLSGCEDIKLLLNAAHFSPSGRRFGTYYGYEG